jgi:PAS domain S-box-containing protein
MKKMNDNENNLQQEIQRLEEIIKAKEGDIAVLKKQNQTLSENNEFFNALMNNIPYVVFFKDKQGRFIRASQSCAEKCRVDNVDEILGKTDFDLFTDEHAKPALKDEKRIMETGEPIIGKEEREVWSDGRVTWSFTAKLPLRNNKGEVIGIFGITRDITEVKQREDQLITLMDNIPDAIYFKDKQSRFTLINKSCARGFGVNNPDEALGKTDFDFFALEHSQPAYDDEQKVMETGEPIIGKEELEVKPDGSETWVHTTKMPLQDRQGNIIGTFGISRDISRIKQTEQRLQALMDNIPDAIYFKDKQSRFTLINKACARVFNLEDPSKALGKSDFDFFSKAHSQPAFDDEQQIIETGEPIIGLEELESWESGEERWVSTTKLPLKDPDGNIVGTFGLSRDINRLKLAEEKLQRSNEELEKIVAKRTAELRKANQAMKIRIQQLDYLNKKAHFFTQLIDRDTLLPVIFYAFVERLPKAEIHLCEKSPDGFRTIYNTDGLKGSKKLESCIKALDHLPSDTGTITTQESWPENAVLKDLFDDSLKKLPCYMVIPLMIEKKMRGAVQAFLPKEFKEIFEQEHIVLNTLASQAAISLDNANNYRELAERARIQSELEIAQSIQKRFTPDDPMIPRFKIKGICKPANEVGGDYLDFFQNNMGDWVLVIADVCGKGIPAALVMTSLRSIIRTEAREQKSSKKLLSAVNNLMGYELQLDNSFITCMVLIIDKDGKSMNFTRAGHPMLISYSSSHEPERIRSEGVALGMLMGEQFDSIVEEVFLDLSKGDKFLAYTDGLDEAMNSGKETYGAERLLKLLNRDKSLKPEKLVENILADIERFCKGHRQYDDLTLFALEKT